MAATILIRDSREAETMKIWINGELLERDQAKISVLDHGLLYGDGVFEGIRAYNGTIFQCDAHLERLYESARTIDLPLAMAKEELAEAMYETLRANDIRDGYIRLLVTRGIGTLGLNPFQCSGGSIIIIADQIALYPPEMYQNGLEVIIAEHVRISPNMLPPAVKSMNYLNNILANIEATKAGAGEAIMLNA
ncbi:MAG: branched-chain amino acid aminotransferase, partial [Planctomycetales bacterium 4484_123]